MSSDAANSIKNQFKNEEIRDDYKYHQSSGDDNTKLVSIISNGTRGDIQPFVAIALELSKKYRVRVLTNSGVSKSFVESFGLTCVEIWPIDPENVVRTHEGLRKCMAEGNTMKFYQIIEELTKEVAKEAVKNFMIEMKRNRPDLLIAGTLAEYFLFYSRRILKLNVLQMQLQCVGFNPDHAPLGIPKLPFGMHFYIVLLAMKSIHNGFERCDEVVVKMGEIPLSMSKKDFMEDTKNNLKGFASHKIVICQSSLFRSILWPNADPKRYIFTGPFIIDSKHQNQHNDKFGGDDTKKRICEFLNQDKGNKPVYLGWGSMLGNTPEAMVVMAVQALIYANERGVILGGYAGLSFEVLCQATDNQDIIAYAKKNVLFVRAASHESLFPLVKCIVHHGGSGTTHASLRSGVPTIITPVFFDQFCQSRVVNELGVGRGFPVGMQKLSYEDIGSAIKSVQTKEIAKRCKELSIHIRQENGNVNAARIVDALLKEGENSLDASSLALQSKQVSYILPELVAGSMKVIMFACLFQFLRVIVL